MVVNGVALLCGEIFVSFDASDKKAQGFPRSLFFKKCHFQRKTVQSATHQRQWKSAGGRRVICQDHASLSHRSSPQSAVGGFRRQSESLFSVDKETYFPFRLMGLFPQSQGFPLRDPSPVIGLPRVSSKGLGLASSPL